MPSDKLDPTGSPSPKNSSISRRKFVAGAGAVAGFVIGRPVAGATRVEAAQETAAGPSSVPLELTINGSVHRLSIDPRVTLLDLLREHLGLTGTKKGCDHGQCGSCTVLADGRRINSCLSLAAVHDGEHIVTVEGLAQTAGGADLHPLQEAFIDHDGFQCGYCTPGQLCSAAAMLKEAAHNDASVVTADLSGKQSIDLNPDEIRERMSGNICRCGAYPGIVAAIQQVHEGRSKKTSA